jgi:CRISPR/Cas system-associated exonuclease Cas4 (RecB family)
MNKSTNQVELEQNQAQEIDVPLGVVTYLEKRTKRTNYVTKSRYSVTDIVSCQRKSYYRSIGIEEEELLNDSSVENMWDSVRGDLLHQLTYAYKWRELDIEYTIPLLDGRVATLAGRLDMYDWKTATIIDLKTTKFVKWQIKNGFIPRTEHILQLQCYNTIFSGTIPVKFLNILYVDMNVIVAYKIQRRDLSGWIKGRVQELENCQLDQNIPVGEVSGLCKFCKFQTLCYNTGSGLTTKPLSLPRDSLKVV